MSKTKQENAMKATQIVLTIANQLRKAGQSLAAALKAAWAEVKRMQAYAAVEAICKFLFTEAKSEPKEIDTLTEVLEAFGDKAKLWEKNGLRRVYINLGGFWNTKKITTKAWFQINKEDQALEFGCRIDGDQHPNWLASQRNRVREIVNDFLTENGYSTQF